MSLQGQGRPAPFVLRGPSLHKEIPPVALVMPLVPLVIKLQPPVSHAISTMSPQGQGRPARPASWGLSPRSEILRVHPATYPVTVATRLPPRVKTVL